MFDAERISKARASARRFGAAVANHEINIGVRPPHGRAGRTSRWTWNRRPPPVAPAATITMFDPSREPSNAEFVAVLDESELAADPDALATLRAAYQEGFDHAVFVKVDTFMRDHLAT